MTWPVAVTTPDAGDPTLAPAVFGRRALNSTFTEGPFLPPRGGGGRGGGTVFIMTGEIWVGGGAVVLASRRDVKQLYGFIKCTR